MMSLAYAFSVLTVFTTFSAAPTPNPAYVVRSEGPVVVVSVFSDKIGVKPMPSAPLELELGHSFTASVVDAGKLLKMGLGGFHEGARVTVTRIAPDKLRVEVEEMEPVAQKEILTLLLDAEGNFKVAPKKS